MLPLQLLGLGQRAGVHHAGVEHGLTVTDPAQNLREGTPGHQDTDQSEESGTDQGAAAETEDMLTINVRID